MPRPTQAPPPNNLPYGGVPGMVLPPNYPCFAVNTTTRREVGVIGLVITLIGAALIVVSFTALDWVSGDDGFGGTERVNFSDCTTCRDQRRTGLSRLYFSWLGWVLLAAVVVFGVLGNLPI